MATREFRLAQFSQGVPEENRPLQILCEDQSGTYIIPYPCEWSEGVWRKVGSTKHIEATVVGWRALPRFRPEANAESRIIGILLGERTVEKATESSGTRQSP